MRVLPVLLAALMLAPVGLAQLPHPHPQVVHHPLTIESELRDIEAINPDFVSLGTFGDSVLGFPLWVMDIYNPDADPADLPVLYLDANHHGNEQLGMESTLIFLEEVAAWSTTDEGAARLAQVRVVVAPAINPDGTGRDARVNMNGVDLNRNYDYNWGLYGTSNTPNIVTGTYRGPSALSEPETMANAALMFDLRPDIYLSMHTGSHDIVLPWNQDPEADGPIPDWDVYAVWLAKIGEVSGLGYRDPSGAGESISYAYGMLGALSVIVEVDGLQNSLLLQQDPRDILAEEVAIFWDALENLELYGGWVQQHGEYAHNMGLGAAYNVTFIDAAGEPLLVVPILDPDTGDHDKHLIPAKAARVEYDRRIQGDDTKIIWGFDVNTADVVPEGEPSTPAPAWLAAAALLVVAIVRRR